MRTPLLLAISGLLAAADYVVPLAELDLDGRALPSVEQTRWLGDQTAFVCAAGAEVWLDLSGDRRVAVRVPDGVKPELLLVLPETWRHSAVFKARLPAKAAPAKAEDVVAVQQAHYRRLHQAGGPGAAVFRALAGTDPQTDEEQRRDRDEFAESIDLFTGGQALAENLQLDRPLRGVAVEGGAVEVSTLAGISAAELDWSLFGPLPAATVAPVDALAALIPADQHAVFFPSFTAMIQAMDRADALGSTVLNAVRAEDGLVRDRYQHQLGLGLTELARQFGPALVESVAMSGGDLSLRLGSDVAILFKPKNEQALSVLKTFIALRQGEIASKDQTATLRNGLTEGIAWTALVSPDRRVSSYLAEIGRAVVVTNSLAQITRLAATAKGAMPSLAGTGDYRHFRARWGRTDDELAFCVLSDACIRRWCSPAVRIADSRRVRAAAVLAALQARQVTGQKIKGEAARLAKLVGVELGEVVVEAVGVRSATFGALGFLTPVGELASSTVSAAEAKAYGAWRDRYQNGFRAWFDPVCLRLTRCEKGLGLNLAVLPLIAGSEYRQMLMIAGNARIGLTAGDPHNGSLLHVLWAFDHKRALGSNGLVGGLVPVQDPWSWMGQSIAIYAEADGFWQELAAAGKDARNFMQKSWFRMPLGALIEVTDPLKLTLFLTGVRAMSEQSAPGMLVWGTGQHRGFTYVTLRPSPKSIESMRELAQATLCYAALPEGLWMSLREDVLKQALDRLADRRAAMPTNQPVKPAWLGETMAARCDGQGLGLLAAMTDQAGGEGPGRLQRKASFANLPILNEWKRRFPAEDPVAVHERWFGIRLVCPGGQGYQYDQTAGTMASVVYGHPGNPKDGPVLPAALARIAAVAGGLTLYRLPSAQDRLHTVTIGEDLAAVAKAENADVGDLGNVNRLDRGADLKPGRVLRIPPETGDRAYGLEAALELDEAP